MNTNRFVKFVIPMFFGMLFSMPALAQVGEVWTHTGSACAIDEGSTALAEAGSARLFFKPNQSGTIYARCNVTNPRDLGTDTNWNRLEVAYRDNDGNSSRSPRVQARLYRVSSNGNLNNGALGNGGVTLIQTLDSSSLNCWRSGDTVCSVAVAHDFDFYKYAYFVELQIDRAVAVGGDPNVSVSAVRLMEFYQ